MYSGKLNLGITCLCPHRLLRLKRRYRDIINTLLVLTPRLIRLAPLLCDLEIFCFDPSLSSPLLSSPLLSSPLLSSPLLSPPLPSPPLPSPPLPSPPLPSPPLPSPPLPSPPLPSPPLPSPPLPSPPLPSPPLPSPPSPPLPSPPLPSPPLPCSVGLLLVVIYYIFAIIGLEFFEGKVGPMCWSVVAFCV